MKKSGKARAHTNIALIKYWGKADENLIIPMNNSLSVTLERFYTETHVTFDDSLTEDQLILDVINVAIHQNDRSNNNNIVLVVIIHKV